LKLKSNILKFSLFATGLSGIVAEYILSTLATYFLGDSVFQWTMIVSIMLFSMGLGSRISKYFKTNLLRSFLYIEFLLSVLVSFSSLFVYSASAFSIYTGLIIYTLSISIGILIGMEIPIVVRLNDEFETLRINVSSVMEKDYYGALVGGLFFAFFGLPYLGLTYTPFVLGIVNFTVALLLYFLLWKQIQKKILINFLAISIGLLIVIGIYFSQPVILWGEQVKYKDKVVYSEQSKYQKIVITQWQDNYWLFLNGNQQFCTLDEVMYHEPLVHPAMKLLVEPSHVLILGGGDGCAVREVLKYNSVKNIKLVDLDPSMTELSLNHHVLLKANDSSLHSPKVQVLNNDAYNFLENNTEFFDIIIIDLPDPRTVELNRLYTFEFYKKCYKYLRPNGVIVTQAGSPYYATKAYKCIEKTLQYSGFSTVPIHNQILTLGEWGWIIGQKIESDNNIKNHLQNISFEDVETKWLNKEAMKLMTSFGKDIFSNSIDSIEINKIHNPVLYKYYLKGNWSIY
jgi:spermidine synthase